MRHNTANTIEKKKLENEISLVCRKFGLISLNFGASKQSNYRKYLFSGFVNTVYGRRLWVCGPTRAPIFLLNFMSTRTLPQHLRTAFEQYSITLIRKLLHALRTTHDIEADCIDFELQYYFLSNISSYQRHSHSICMCCPHLLQLSSSYAV